MRPSVQRLVRAVRLLATVGIATFALASAHAGADVTNRQTGAFPGYTLVAPQTTTNTFLLDLDGNPVHTWTAGSLPGLSAHLRGDGLLLRTGRADPQPATFAQVPGGGGGVLELLDWDSTVVSRVVLADERRLQHHDAVSLPNGNVLALVWESKTADEAVAAGRDPSLLSDGHLFPDSIVEVDPARGRIVWEWKVWDHLVQDFDPNRPNHGRIAASPRRIDLNWTTNGGQASWNHLNGIAYDPRRDHVIVSSREFSELWVIDHATTTKQARGTRGDLLARYGNPEAYGHGDSSDRVLFFQHDPSVIPRGTPGAGHFLAFSNGDAAARPHSTVEEIIPARNGRKFRTDGGTFRYRSKQLYPTTRTGSSMFASFISGVQRLPNGNLLITDGPTGQVQEVTTLGTEVWRFQNDVFTPMPVVRVRDFEIRPERLFNVERYAPDDPALRDRELPPPAPSTGYRY